ncbi:RES family NAD+ phosphorylase [Tunicatimonas pelagia]|uniref:RES family NAD+ phosphorylase n=1 Tax=Tunicatimonas pelagia TaxID=931531 RepID=UPI002665DB1D|nr:RES family NAD+ phosphorylase [Tunicatimonas pelagia]WKN43136.1 RES family NAD+ phosphorylase [Tunicatimonas pelagia]
MSNVPSEVFRISRVKYASDLTGTGARLHGGRWNSKGQSVLYTASSRALAAVELAVHLDLNDLPDDLIMTTLTLPESATMLLLKSLPREWNRHPPSSASKKIGDDFLIENHHLALAVPSVVVDEDINYLLNPNHPLFAKVNIKRQVPFHFDPRLGQY